MDSVKPVLVEGKNKSDFLELHPDAFLYAQAQQNYAALFFFNENKELEKRLLRTTLSELEEQLPAAERIHRSYLVNPFFVEEISGNARKRFVHIQKLDAPLPLSGKYYELLQNRLSNLSQNNQNQP